MSEIVDGPTGGRGKWSQAGVPHHGWVCINYEDRGEPAMRCQMCESSEIRYVQYMQHPRYPRVLACGVVCAGHMEQGIARAQDREKRMKSAARRREHFPKRVGWYPNKNGNPQIKVDGFTITVFQKNGFYRAVVNHRLKSDGTFTRDSFPTLVLAQRAAFDTWQYMAGELDIG